MRASKSISAAVILTLSAGYFPAHLSVRAQQPSDTLRIETQLVQTDVLVLNKDGEFVNGLNAANFELRVNGKPRSISSFDHVVAGSANEEERMAAARGLSKNGSVAADRGRTILFYLDDYHLSSTSVMRIREMLENFVTRQMGIDDQVAVVTATGQLGFLEQFASEPAVIRRGISKLVHRNFNSGDAERMTMTESDAAAISADDRRVLDYFADQLLKDMGRQPRGRSTPLLKARSDVETMVKARARSILEQSTALSVAALTGLEKWIKLTATMPWRKTLFFISEGFMLHDRSNPGLDLRRIANTAAQSATVIYSIDAQGLISGTSEASRKVAFDYGRNAGTSVNAISLSQQPLQSLAADSGGRAVFNSNAPSTELDRALKETTNYYLISWRPEASDLTRDASFQVSVIGRPELSVRLRRGVAGLSSSPDPAPAKKNSSKKSNNEKDKEKERPLNAALRSLTPRADLPMALSVGFANAGPKTQLITATVELPLDALVDSAAATESIELDLLGASINESGRPVADFDQGLTIKPNEMKTSGSNRVLYSHQFNLPPGLFQIRVAVQDKRTDRIASAMQWIEVPDLSSGAFVLSSLFVGDIDNTARESGKLSVNASHRFHAGSSLGYFLSAYNAPRSAAGSDLVLQLQVIRDQQPVITKPVEKIDTTQATDPASIPYGEELSLAGLPAGNYLLTITIIDRASKSSARQQAKFVIY